MSRYTDDINEAKLWLTSTKTWLSQQTEEFRKGSYWDLRMAVPDDIFGTTIDGDQFPFLAESVSHTDGDFEEDLSVEDAVITYWQSVIEDLEDIESNDG